MPKKHQPTEPSPDVDQTEVISRLGDPRSFGSSRPVRRIDAHGAVVFRIGEDVFKIKRAVRFPFMDFSTLEKRQVVCEAEISVNKPSAPTISLGVVPIARTREAVR